MRLAVLTEACMHSINATLDASKDNNADDEELEENSEEDEEYEELRR